MIDFKEVTAKERDILESYLSGRAPRGCDYSFTNLVSWGHHEYALIHGMLILRYLGGEGCYLFPVGDGDAACALSEILKDAGERGRKCIIKSMTAEEAKLTEKLFGTVFTVKADRDSFDYVYLTEALSELKGKHYHGKRGHYAKFFSEYPSCSVSRIPKHSVKGIGEMLDIWYAERDRDSFTLEREAIARLLDNMDSLGADGVCIKNGEEVIAFSLGSMSGADTFDVHFEKASSSVPTAYTAIAVELAKYVRANHPEAVYLNREDDMGIEGLRRAKESWYPHHMIEKYTAEAVFSAID